MQIDTNLVAHALKNEVNTFPSVSPPCLFSLIAFEIRCIGRVLLVLGSRFKNEVNMHISLCFSSTFIFTDRKSTRLNSSHMSESRMPSSA